MILTTIVEKIREMRPLPGGGRVIVCLLWLLVSASAAAQDRDISFWPTGFVPVNGVIILSNVPRHVADSLIKEGTFRLASDVDTVALRIAGRTCGSSVEERCLIELRPERQLLPNGRYGILAGRPEARRLFGSGSPHWTALERSDTVPPEWLDSPAYIGGCDRNDPYSAHYAYLALSVEELGSYAVEVTVTDPEMPGDTTKHLFVPRDHIMEQFSDAMLVSDKVILQLDPVPNGQRVSVPDRSILSVGTGPYGGTLEFERGRNVRISMRLVDAAGNRSGREIEATLDLSGRSPFASPESGAGESPTAGGVVPAAPSPGGSDRKPTEATGPTSGRPLPTIPVLRTENR